MLDLSFVHIPVQCRRDCSEISSENVKDLQPPERFDHPLPLLVSHLFVENHECKRWKLELFCTKMVRLLTKGISKMGVQ